MLYDSMGMVLETAYASEEQVLEFFETANPILTDSLLDTKERISLKNYSSI